MNVGMQPVFLLAIYLVLKFLNPKPGWASHSYDTDNLIQTLLLLNYKAEVNMSASEREGGSFSEGPGLGPVSVINTSGALAGTASVHTPTQPRHTDVNLEIISRDTSQEPGDRDAEGKRLEEARVGEVKEEDVTEAHQKLG